MRPIFKNLILTLSAVIFLTACDEMSSGTAEPKAVTEVESPHLLNLISKARSGDTAAQFELGIAYFTGSGAVRDLVESYIWFTLAAFQGHEAATIAAQDVERTLKDFGLIKDARLKGQIYYSHYIKKKNTSEPPDDFVFTINGLRYQFVAAVTPRIPIIVKGTHSDPSVTTVRLQNVDDPKKQMKFNVGLGARIANTEKHMQSGNTSKLEFVALDQNGRRRGSVVVMFVPGYQSIP